MKTRSENAKDEILAELKELDKEAIHLENGVLMKPSQCYSFSFYPRPHFLYNTNCSQELKDKLQTIFKKYYKGGV
jgi:predicted Zn-ribbon and HTH transcriptional regulator